MVEQDIPKQSFYGHPTLVAFGLVLWLSSHQRGDHLVLEWLVKLLRPVDQAVPSAVVAARGVCVRKLPLRNARRFWSRFR